MPRVEKPDVSESERAAVLALVDKYGSSLIAPDLASLASCFHDQATIFASFDAALQGGPIAWLYDNLTQNGGITGLQFDIQILSLTATTAVAQIALYREAPAYEITDFLSLVKQPHGNWAIVSKIFHVYQYT